MKKELSRLKKRLFHNVNGNSVDGPNPSMTGYFVQLWGDCSNLRGRCSGLWGDCSGLAGDCTGVCGDCTGICGSLDWCEITPAERAGGVDIETLVEP